MTDRAIASTSPTFTPHFDMIRVSEDNWHFARKQLAMMPRRTIELESEDRTTYAKFIDNPPVYINQVQGFRVDGDEASAYFLAAGARILVRHFEDLDFPIGADILELYANYDEQF